MQHLRAGSAPVDSSDDMLRMLDADRPDPPPRRPWVTSNMVMSLDGAYAEAGRSGGLSSDADHRLFLAQRSLADVVLVGASTARAERYRRPVAAGLATQIRAQRGQAPRPLLAVTSRSLALPDDLPLLDGDGPTPLLVHPTSADTSRAPAGVDLLASGTDGVDFAHLLGMLHARGARWVVCEGGPGVLGQLASLDLIDEYLLTISPRLVGGSDVGLLAGVAAHDVDMELHRVLRDGEHLLLSYRRR